MKKALLNTVRPEYSELNTTPFSFIQKLELNFNSLDNETIQVLNDSEYLERLDMLWSESAD